MTPTISQGFIRLPNDLGGQQRTPKVAVERTTGARSRGPRPAASRHSRPSSGPRGVRLLQRPVRQDAHRCLVPALKILSRRPQVRLRGPAASAVFGSLHLHPRLMGMPKLGPRARVRWPPIQGADILG
jgi:hypothetical protein